MPYNPKKPPKDLVKKIKKRHPKAGAKEIRQFVYVFNNAIEDGDSEARAFAKAWGVLNRSKKLKSSHRKTDPAKTKKEIKKQEKKDKKKKAGENMTRGKLKRNGFVQMKDKPGLWEHPETGEQWAWSYESEYFYPIKEADDACDKLLSLSSLLYEYNLEEAGQLVAELAYQAFLPVAE